MGTIARLNMNEIPYFSWKGKTFNQITSAFQKNQNTIQNPEGNTLFNALPLKIYRREIGSVHISGGNPRYSVSIDQINAPGGYQISNNVNDCSFGIITTVNAKDLNISNNKYENGTCSITNPCMNPASNALRRVRSSGMIKKNNKTYASNYDIYYTSNKQLLEGRNKTYTQNQYIHLRQGDNTTKPGDNLSASNLYYSTSYKKCAKYHITSDLGNNTFQYQWLDANYYTVTLPDGYYDISDLVGEFKNIMITNMHYLINKSNSAKLFLLNIAYNNSSKTIELQSLAYNTSAYSTTIYSYPDGSTWSSYVTNAISSATSLVPVFYILSNTFQDVVGFSNGYYPSQTMSVATNKTYQSTTSGSFTYSANQYNQSTSASKLIPSYSAVYYKPNNFQFAQQGGVSSSSRITRLKYNTITNNTANFQTAYGQAAANALAYGVSDKVYTVKDKIGFSLTKTPVFSKYSDGFNKCDRVSTIRSRA
jgi:hypothetical protein